MKYADRLITISDTHKEQWLRELNLGFGSKRTEFKIKVIYNGVNLKRFKPNVNKNCSSKIRFALVAQLTDVKGHKLLLHVTKQLIQNGYDFELKIAGDGPLRQELESWLEEGNIREKVQFLGMINQVETFMHNIDVVVLPSFREGLALC